MYMRKDELLVALRRILAMTSVVVVGVPSGVMKVKENYRFSSANAEVIARYQGGDNAGHID